MIHLSVTTRDSHQQLKFVPVFAVPLVQEIRARVIVAVHSSRRIALEPGIWPVLSVMVLVVEVVALTLESLLMRAGSRKQSLTIKEGVMS